MCRRCATGCTEAGIDTFEADVRFATRYLIERGIKAGCEIEGVPTATAGNLAAVFDNPALRPAEVSVERMCCRSISRRMQGRAPPGHIALRARCR